MSLKLTYGELEIGDKYIGFPLEGDDHGHGGYKGIHYLFIRTKVGSVRVVDGMESNMPYDMEVIKVGL